MVMIKTIIYDSENDSHWVISDSFMVNGKHIANDSHH